MANMSLSALFNFEDGSSDVGPVEWIVSGEAKVGEVVKVLWRNTSDSRKKREELSARIIAINSDVNKLFNQRENSMGGESISSDSSDDELEEVPRKKKKKADKSLAVLLKLKDQFEQEDPEDLIPLSAVSRENHNSTQNARLIEENQRLLAKNRDLEEENRSLLATIKLTRVAPTLVHRLEKVLSRQPTQPDVPLGAGHSSTSISNGIPQGSPRSLEQDQSTSMRSPLKSSEMPMLQVNPEDIPQSLPKGQKTTLNNRVTGRCSLASPQKFVNDLLQAIYTTEYMAVHSITGTARPGGSGTESKPPMDQRMLKEIIDAVKIEYKDVSTAQVNYAIRQKLNNAAKIWKGQQKL